MNSADIKGIIQESKSLKILTDLDPLHGISQLQRYYLPPTRENTTAPNNHRALTRWWLIS